MPHLEQYLFTPQLTAALGTNKAVMHKYHLITSQRGNLNMVGLNMHGGGGGGGGGGASWLW